MKEFYNNLSDDGQSVLIGLAIGILLFFVIWFIHRIRIPYLICTLTKGKYYKHCNNDCEACKYSRFKYYD